MLTTGILHAVLAVAVLQGDSTLPAAITTLSATVTGSTTVDLSWINVADDGTDSASGPVSVIDIWYSSDAPITPQNWNQVGIDWTGEPSPHDPGMLQVTALSGLEPGRTYWFVMWSGDENWPIGAWSPISNNAVVTMPGAGPLPYQPGAVVREGSDGRCSGSSRGRVPWTCSWLLLALAFRRR